MGGVGRQQRKRSQAMGEQHSSLYLDGAHNLSHDYFMMDLNQTNSGNVSKFPLYIPLPKTGLPIGLKVFMGIYAGFESSINTL